jgi:hypothetical protein
VIPDRDSNELHNRLLLWHRETGSLLGEWEDPTRLTSPGEQEDFIATAGEHTALTVRADGSVAAWHMSPESWADDLCTMFGDLDAGRRDRYLPATVRVPVCG